MKWLIFCMFLCRVVLFQILHMHVSQVEKLPLTTGGSPLLVRCKNFMCVTFVIPRERDCQDIFLSLQEFSRPSKLCLFLLDLQLVCMRLILCMCVQSAVNLHPHTWEFKHHYTCICSYLHTHTHTHSLSLFQPLTSLHVHFTCPAPICSYCIK